MANKSLRILAVFDVPWTPENKRFSDFLKDPDWKDERDVVNALKRNGHTVELFGIYDDVIPLIELVKEIKPDLIFNMCESFNHCRDLEPNLVAMFELLGVKYTGATSEALRICKDKGLTKKILDYHDIRIPQFHVFNFKQSRIKIPENMIFPAIVKPISMEASEGISENSRVTNAKECTARIRYIHNKFKMDAIVEEFIEGREIYIGVIGNETLNVFPPMELYFKNVPKNKPKFMTYKAKWDSAYRKKWGIDSSKAKRIEPRILNRINKVSREIYKLFYLRGYARFDLRLTAENEIVFLEANPNPSIARIDDFAQGAKQKGIKYDLLIEKITNLAIAS